MTFEEYLVLKFKLSRAEYRVLYVLLQGATNKDIANRLFVTEKTVKFHMTALHKKMGARNRLELVIKAKEIMLREHLDALLPDSLKPPAAPPPVVVAPEPPPEPLPEGAT